MILSKSRSGVLLLLSALLLGGCDWLKPSETDPDVLEPIFKTYQSGMIFAYWTGGRTGTPLETEAVNPAAFPENGTTTSSYCPKSALILLNHSSIYPFGLVIQNTCTARIELLVCASAGSSGGNTELPTCNVDPRTTPASRLLPVDIASGSESNQGINTSVNLAVSVFWCGIGDDFSLGVIAGKNPTDCIQH